MVIQRTALSKRTLIQSAAFAAVGLAASRAGAQTATTDTFTGGAQTYTVPATGMYNIAAYGGQGGSATFNGTVGGQGAEAAGFFSLTAGTKLTIDVGGMGGSNSRSGGGGGGSFVYNTTTSTLLLVGGGGGGGYVNRSVGGGGQTTQGNGSGGASGAYSGGGGGGFKGNGDGGAYYGGGGGGGFPSGLTGGGGFGNYSGTGAFGGGGGGGYGGGGGGYTGGNGGHMAGGVGGTSFDAGTMQTLAAGSQTGNGDVVITPVASGVPEPGSLALVGFAALAAGTGFGLRRRVG